MSKGKTYFKVNQFVSYPSLGIGQIVCIETIGNVTESYYVVRTDDCTVRVAVSKAERNGMRAIGTMEDAERVVKVLAEKAAVHRKANATRERELEVKVKTNDLLQLAEVVRDCFRPDSGVIFLSCYDRAWKFLFSELRHITNMEEDELLKWLERKTKKKFVPPYKQMPNENKSIFGIRNKLSLKITSSVSLI